MEQSAGIGHAMRGISMFRSLVRWRLWRFVASLGGVLAPVAVRAQEDAASAAAFGPEKSFVYQYFLVGLCIALGVLLLVQPRKREESIESRADLAFHD
jgi:hypothetical protein